MGTALTLAELARRLAAAPDRARQAVREALPACVPLAVGAVKAGVYAGTSPDGSPLAPLKFPRPTGGAKPLLDTGQMVNSLSGVASDDTLTLRAGGRQARLMQFGGVVRPTSAKALAIPVTRDAKRAGSPRRFPRELFVLPGKAGGALAERRGKGKAAKVVVHYLLRASVTVPARPWVGFSDETKARIGRVVLGRVQGSILGG